MLNKCSHCIAKWLFDNTACLNIAQNTLASSAYGLYPADNPSASAKCCLQMLHIPVCRELLQYPVQKQRLLPLSSGYSASINPAPYTCVMFTNTYRPVSHRWWNRVHAALLGRWHRTPALPAQLADQTHWKPDHTSWRAAHCDCHHTLPVQSYIPAQTSFTAIPSTLQQQAASKAANATQHLMNPSATEMTHQHMACNSKSGCRVKQAAHTSGPARLQTVWHGNSKQQLHTQSMASCTESAVYK